MYRSASRRRFIANASLLFLAVIGLAGGTIIQAAPPVENNDATALAASIVQQAGFDRGLCAVLGNDANLPLALARTTHWQIHVREPDPAAVARLRTAADEAGLDIRRLAMERGSLSKLPYADNTVDLLICCRASDKVLGQLSAVEVLRVLRPEGMALIADISDEKSPAQRTKDLKHWVSDAREQRNQVSTAADVAWLRLVKPPRTGIDDWSHWEKGPDNNPVSHDQVIRAPYMSHFLAEPFYIGMPAVTTVAGGRTFLAIGHIAHHQREWNTLGKLVARNGYNGIILWERDLPEGYPVHRSAFIATKDTFYMMEGERCLLLDAGTGKQTGEIRIADVPGEWKWMARHQGVLYVLAGKPGARVEKLQGDSAHGGWSWDDLSKEYYGKQIPFALGDTLAAYDLKKNQVLWTHKEDTLIDARGLAIEGKQLYLYCSDRHLRALAADSGKVLWTNADPKLLELIATPGVRLASTPGWKTQSMIVATPDALIIQGQTLMNVVAISANSGSLLWTKKKITNNPNAIFVEGKVVLGVGQGGSHVVVDPTTGKVEQDLKFHKVSCTRLTASTDSYFCRGEGLTRFDRATNKLLIDGAARPACNDGALPANGLLYLGPWQCDCNLSLIGALALCSAGDFQFDIQAKDEERLELGEGDTKRVAPLEIAASDWPTYRADRQRSASTQVEVPPAKFAEKWRHEPSLKYVPTAPTAAGGLIFVGGSDGKVRAIDAENGKPVWQYSTPAPITYPPTLWNGRAYFGSADGYAYCLEAATGRLLWRFRAAPAERYINVYGALSSTWPVGSGVLVDDGVAYFAAGIIDHDGTYVYAVDAESGKLRWQNTTSGHLNADLRKGVSVQGNLAILGNRLLLAGGNQVSPAAYDRVTGKCLNESFDQGQPKANGGRFVGVFRDQGAIQGGRTLYAAPQNVASKGFFDLRTADKRFIVNWGGIPASWSNESVVVVNYLHGRVSCLDGEKFADYVRQSEPAKNPYTSPLCEAVAKGGGRRWQSDLGPINKFEAVALAVARNAVVGAVRYQELHRAWPQWFLILLNGQDGRVIARHELPGEPLPDGLLIDRAGRVVVTMLDGSVICCAAAAQDK